jgi:hypothetical protein
VLTIRCIKKLLTRLKASPDSDPAPSTTKLGDWYANLIYVQGQPLVLAMSERTLLPVLFPVRGKEPLRHKLIQAVGETLSALGIEDFSAEKELTAMADVSIAKTASRVVLESMKDFAFLLDAWFDPEAPLVFQSLRLARVACSPLKDVFPDKAAAIAISRLGGHLMVV